jgi:hypothetical protein
MFFSSSVSYVLCYAVPWLLARSIRQSSSLWLCLCVAPQLLSDLELPKRLYLLRPCGAHRLLYLVPGTEQATARVKGILDDLLR